MLRRNLGSGQPLELRHQRTGDVVFDWVDPTNRFKTPQYYAYKLIETLLPKANPTDKQAENMTIDKDMPKLIHLWAHDEQTREWWLKVV